MLERWSTVGDRLTVDAHPLLEMAERVESVGVEKAAKFSGSYR
jgi:hypothetical protein